MLFRIIITLLIFIVNFVKCNIKHTTIKQLIPANSLQVQKNEILFNNNFNSIEEKICTDIDVRNYISNFDVLRGCTVVEGYVQINLIDNSTYQDFANISFPELREITEYLLFFHVSGLKSIGTLFPNLSIIRGNGLVWEYTFAVFSMPNLQEILLPRLTHIMKGSVIIMKNPGLCYVKTVDWKRIAKKNSVALTNNKSPEECKREQQTTRSVDCDNYWSSTECQMTTEIDKCHHLCAGGCNGTTANDCFVCLGLVYNGECLERCPPNMYNYMNRRCLTREECLNNRRVTNKNFPVGMKMSYSDKAKWRPFNGSCIDECPPGYNSTADETSCVPCPGLLCPKVCKGIIVKSIDQAREAKGCTFIDGSVEVQVQTGDSELVAQELEKGLGMITEISGHLKLSHSLPVQSLNFLKRLRVIHGDPMNENEASIHSNYSLIVWDNSNLQELWDWSLKPYIDVNVPKFEIKKGKVLFHDNPKLCIEKIYELVNITKISFDSFDVLKESNGDEYMCGASELGLDVLNKTDVSFYFQLNGTKENSLENNGTAPFNQVNNTNNQRYVLFYAQAESGYYTNFDTVGNCEASGWKYKDINSKDRTCEVTELEPATEYAFFVKIYDSKSIVRSNISFQTTLPAKPSAPEQFEVVGTNYSSISLEWAPPKHPHGDLDKYVIRVFFQEYDIKYLDTRNYCDNRLLKISDSSLFQSYSVRHSKYKTKIGYNCCEKEISCDFDHESFHYVTSHQQLIQTCDNYISTYLQYYDIHRAFDLNLESNLQNVSKVDTFEIPVPSTSFVISGLGHFNTVVLTISACRHSHKDQGFLPDDPIEKRCSDNSLVIARTNSNPEADIIDSNSVRIERINSSTLFLTWTVPRKPNGIIVNFDIKYQRGSENIDICKTRKEIEKDQGAYFYDLLSGNYNFRVRAVSLGGDGQWTDWKPYYVESSESSSSFIIIFIVICTLFVGCMVAFIIFLLCLQRRRSRNATLYTSVNPEYVKVPYVVDEWEMNRDDIQLLKVLGKGTFGIVHQGFIKSRNMKCAVKTIMDGATDRDRMEFLYEATTMKTFSSASNIVGLLGVVSQGHPPLIIIELMGLGDLKTFLRNTRDSDKAPQLPSIILIKMAAQIADGMEYMEARKFVHRDIAARNCMVADDLSVKIGDLGMSRDVYHTDYYRKSGRGLLPVRWMAPESLNDGVFTSSSDVWSYGIVLWEMTMLAEQPYQGYSNEEVLQMVISGKTLSNVCMPTHCPDVLKNIMLKSWAWKPSNRPTFHYIINLYEEYLDDKFRSTSFHHSEECKEMRNALSKPARRVMTNEGESDKTEVVHTESAIDQTVSYHKTSELNSTNSNGGILKES